MRIAAFLLVFASVLPAMALAAAPVVLVPLDDRPVTRQLPQMLGAIAGRTVLEPPRTLLGNYLTFGQPDAIDAWLNGPAARGAGAYVISTDMLMYGGLVASRTPSTPYADAYFRLRALQQLRYANPHAWIGAFGTIMRLAPTGVPALGDAASFFAAYPGWYNLWKYANLHDPPLPSEQTLAQRYLDAMPPGLLDGYLVARARDYGTDLLVLQRTADGTIDRSVLGQDDAGPVGLHVKDVRTLQDAAAPLGARTSIEPGADELGMALVANALARGAHWSPRVKVVYSTPDGAMYQDKLEFAPISLAITSLIALCGGVAVDTDADLTLYVRVPGTSNAQDDAFLAALREDAFAGHSAALADLSFLNDDTFAVQAAFAKRMLDDGTMGRIDAYASWNTNANTVGTALAEAIAAGAGRRTKSYNELAHREFTFNRVMDDVIFHTEVRPQLIAALKAEKIDQTYLLPEVAKKMADENRALLWARSGTVLSAMYPSDHIAAMTITLPWNRTFETEIDAALAPNRVGDASPGDQAFEQSSVAASGQSG